MSITEILEELPKLNSDEWRLLVARIQELEAEQFEETPEMLAAIDAGRRSIREGKHYTVEQARQLIGQWTTKSS